MTDSHIPTITITLTARNISRHKSDGSFWRKGDVQFEYRTFMTRGNGLPAHFGLCRFPSIPGCKQPHYTYTGTRTELFPGIFGYGLDWEDVLQLVKDRMLAHAVAQRLTAQI